MKRIVSLLLLLLSPMVFLDLSLGHALSLYWLLPLLLMFFLPITLSPPEPAGDRHPPTPSPLSNFTNLLWPTSLHPSPTLPPHSISPPSSFSNSTSAWLKNSKMFGTRGECSLSLLLLYVLLCFTNRAPGLSLSLFASALSGVMDDHVTVVSGSLTLRRSTLPHQRGYREPYLAVFLQTNRWPWWGECVRRGFIVGCIKL